MKNDRKRKNIEQMMYDANNDKELLLERNIAKDLCYQFNQLIPSDQKNQSQIMVRLLGKLMVPLLFFLLFGVIMATILKLVKIFLQIITQ